MRRKGKKNENLSNWNIPVPQTYICQIQNFQKWKNKKAEYILQISPMVTKSTWFIRLNSSKSFWSYGVTSVPNTTSVINEIWSWGIKGLPLKNCLVTNKFLTSEFLDLKPKQAVIRFIYHLTVTFNRTNQKTSWALP